MDRQAGEVLRNSRMQSTVRKEGHMFKLEFKTDTGIFKEFPIFELRRVLNRVRDEVNEGATSGIVRDYNGNTIGSYELTEDH